MEFFEGFGFRLMATSRAYRRPDILSLKLTDCAAPLSTPRDSGRATRGPRHSAGGPPQFPVLAEGLGVRTVLPWDRERSKVSPCSCISCSGSSKPHFHSL